MIPNTKYVDKKFLKSFLFLNGGHFELWNDISFTMLKWDQNYVSLEKLCRREISQRNIFESYNFSIVSGGHFGFLQTKHEWGFKTLKEDMKWVRRKKSTENEVSQKNIW